MYIISVLTNAKPNKKLRTNEGKKKRKIIFQNIKLDILVVFYLHFIFQTDHGWDGECSAGRAQSPIDVRCNQNKFSRAPNLFLPKIQGDSSRWYLPPPNFFFNNSTTKKLI